MARLFGPILLLDDDADSLFYTKAAIAHSRVGNPVFTFTCGAELMAHLKRTDGRDPNARLEPSVLFLDLRMPRVGGFEVLKWVREQPQLDPMKVFMLTSSTRDADRKRAEELGADGYIVKPLSAARLQEILHSA